MKKSLIVLNLLLFASTVFAQDFKDVYESLQVNDRFSNMMNLQHSQSTDPDRAITYFLLGEIYDEYMEETNPLLMYNFLEMNYHQALTYYSLVKVKLNDKQARQDRDYYGNIEIITDKKKVGLPDIIHEVDKRLASVKAYFENAQSVHDNYIRCINKYNSCLFKYRRISQNYPDYKTLCLQTTPELKAEIKNIALNFDSALVFFDTYRESCEKLSHLLKINTYHLNPIVTYRLEGLIEADFEAPVVELWDFKTWALNFIEVMDNDIAEIRTGLVKTDNALDAQIKKLKDGDVYSDEMAYYQPEDKFQNLIGKYDHASLCNELINYKKSKIEYLVQTRTEVNNVYDSASFYLINKLRFFKGLSEQLVLLNNQVEMLRRSISVDDVVKYITFFDTRYSGMDRLARWCQVEKYDNLLAFNANLSHLDEFIRRDSHKYDYSDSVLVYNKKKIAFGIQYGLPDSTVYDTLITTEVVPFRKHWHYLSGIELDAKNRRRAFMAQVSPMGEIAWWAYPSRQWSHPDISTEISELQVLDDSTSFVVSHTTTSTVDSLNFGKVFLDRYNWKGKLIKHTLLDTADRPVYFLADEIQEEYLLITEKRQNSVQLMSVRLYNFTDSLKWEKEFQLSGNIANVILTNSDFFIVCNYTVFQVPSASVSLNCREGQQGVLALYITRNGELKAVNNYLGGTYLGVYTAMKITSNSINLIGNYTGNDNKDEIFYLLVDESGEPVFSNFDKLDYKQLEFECNGKQ